MSFDTFCIFISRSLEKSSSSAKVFKIFVKKCDLEPGVLTFDVFLYPSVKPKSKIKDAFKKGAGLAVSSSVKNSHQKNIIKVYDPISFLNCFAKLKRESSLAKIISITGSAGKTSLKNF